MSGEGCRLVERKMIHCANEPSKPRGVVLLDLDDTLIDTLGLYLGLVADIVSRYTGMDRSDVAGKYRELLGMSFRDQLAAMGLEGDSLDRAYREFVESKKRLMQSASMPESVVRFSEKMRSRGFATVISTNNECEVVSVIRGIEHFNLILCYDGHGHRKGRPHLESLAKTLDVPFNRMVYVGDADYDVQLYSSLGIPSVKTKGLFRGGEAGRIEAIVLRLLGERG